MADENILEAFPGATKTFCNFVFNQIQDGMSCMTGDRKVIFWNRAASQLAGSPNEEVTGRFCFADMSLFVSKEGTPICGENCPGTMTLKDGIIRTYDAFMLHKEGFRFPVTLKIMPVFQENGEIAGIIETFSGATPKITIPLKLAELEKTGFIDPETGIADRRYLDMILATRIGELEKHGLSFGTVYVDLDNFGKIQEKYGRFNAGKILRTAALIIQKNIRYFDIVGRIGPDEFLVLLLNVDEGRLDIVANKLRLLIGESYIVTETGMLNTTASMGACVANRFDTAEALIKRAEQLARHSKWLGKNRVSLSFTGKGGE